MVNFRALCDTPEKMARFRQKYRIPDDVDLRLNEPNDFLDNYTPGLDVIHIPVMAIVEGGVRFPLSTLLCQTLNFYNICPMQCKVNTFRVIMGVDRLNSILGTVLGPKEIRDVYSLCRHGEPPYREYYLKHRGTPPPLVTQLPDSSKGGNDDFFIVTGGWYAKDAAGNPAVNPPPNRYSPCSESPTCLVL